MVLVNPTVGKITFTWQPGDLNAPNNGPTKEYWVYADSNEAITTRLPYSDVTQTYTYDDPRNLNPGSLHTYQVKASGPVGDAEAIP